MSNTTAIQAVHIRSHEQRSQPKPHTVYKIDIQANVRSWSMWRRYSEFDDLHIELTKSTGSPPPYPLPPKHPMSVFRFSSKPDEKVLDERTSELETYLRAIVSAKEPKWRDSFAFREFLGIPVGKQPTSTPGQFTSSSWLDEHVDLQARIRQVRADINKRDALSDRGDIANAHKSNVAAKQTLAGIFTRVGNLESGLRELGMSGMSEGELQRRTDMAARLRDDCEKLTKMVTVARISSARAAGGGTTAAAVNPAPESDRHALMGSGAIKPSKGRVFGTNKVQETEITRPLDDHGLLGLQQTQMEEQDSQLSLLSSILQRQKHLGQAIGSEIEQQNEMLDDLTNEVDRVGGKLSSANKQMNRLGK